MRTNSAEALVLNIPQVANALDLCTGTVWNMIRSGELKSLKLRDRRVVRRVDLERFLEQAAEAAA